MRRTADTARPVHIAKPGGSMALKKASLTTCCFSHLPFSLAVFSEEISILLIVPQ